MRFGCFYLAPDDLARWLLGGVPVPSRTQHRNQEQSTPSLFLGVGRTVMTEFFRRRWLRVGIPDFDQDTRAVARQPQENGRLLPFRRGLDGVGHQFGYE